MEEIRISKILRIVFDNKKRFIINAVIVFVLACAYILCFPRYYRSAVSLAPETGQGASLNSLTSIASTFGIDLGGVQSTDAISPELYPDLIKSTDFIVKVLGVQVTVPETNIRTNYYTYLSDYQKHTPWSPFVHRVKGLLKRKPKPRILPNGTDSGDGGINPFFLSEKEYMMVESLKSDINCTIDKKTDVITISVTDQDPVICAQMADSIRVYLQDFITQYRTNKARIDVDYYRILCNQALADYEASIKVYGQYADAHSGSLRQSFNSRRDELENEMQAKLTTLVALRQQLQAAEAKLQERTPAFTILQNASVPIKPAGPKRMIFVAFMTFLSIIGTYLWLIRNQIKERLGFTSAAKNEVNE